MNIDIFSLKYTIETYSFLYVPTKLVLNSDRIVVIEILRSQESFIEIFKIASKCTPFNKKEEHIEYVNCKCILLRRQFLEPCVYKSSTNKFDAFCTIIQFTFKTLYTQMYIKNNTKIWNLCLLIILVVIQGW